VSATPGYSWSMKLAVGDAVVYGTHGAGHVVKRKQQVADGVSREVVVLELEDGLAVTLPLERARELLRPVASRADLRRLREMLREDRDLSSDPWLSRRRETMEKLTAGTLAGLAEVVSEGAQRERLRQASGATPRLPTAERGVFLKARGLLSGEIALALSLPASAAEDWIDEQLARPE
jgi:RNA polymerase-interacting CarD/CdnL/TRCF family regulator